MAPFGGGVPQAYLPCPFCQYQGPPRMEKKISTAGWVVFGVLLWFCFPLCWIGLLMKEDKQLCGSCNNKVG